MCAVRAIWSPAADCIVVGNMKRKVSDFPPPFPFPESQGVATCRCARWRVRSPPSHPKATRVWRPLLMTPLHRNASSEVLGIAAGGHIFCRGPGVGRPAVRLHDRHLLEGRCAPPPRLPGGFHCQRQGTYLQVDSWPSYLERPQLFGVATAVWSGHSVITEHGYSRLHM